jgi:hypothetical protein
MRLASQGRVLVRPKRLDVFDARRGRTPTSDIPTRV